MLEAAAPRPPLLGGAAATAADASLEEFLQHASRMFGRDPDKWERIGACGGWPPSPVGRGGAHARRRVQGYSYCTGDGLRSHSTNASLPHTSKPHTRLS